MVVALELLVERIPKKETTEKVLSPESISPSLPHEEKQNGYARMDRSLLRRLSLSVKENQP